MNLNNKLFDEYKPKGNITGITDLWDLPYNLVYIQLNDDFKSKFKEILLKKGKTKKYISLYARVPFHEVMNFFNGQSKSLAFFEKMINFLYVHDYFKISHETIMDNIMKIGTKTNGKFIYSPKFPINFNCPEGAVLISAILHDGGLIKEPLLYPFYRNYNKRLRLNLIEKSISLIGNMKINLEDTHPNFPKILGIILKYGIGICDGPKTISNQKIPEFIIDSDDIVKGEFLRQAFDDDGSVYIRKDSNGGRVIDLTNTIDVKKDKTSNLLLDNKKLLNSLGIKVKGPIFKREYKTKKGETKHTYKIFITYKKDFKIFKEKIGFISEEKQKKLNRIVI
ncbi:MAG: LAGLIDADG family homing endonuclease [Candidatus Woesearchaeota archaeon]|jgi:hypothetical protein|nr:LAGLIDADG family homing endonuclease [Candidatus Woesearchaeota archaeon]